MLRPWVALLAGVWMCGSTLLAEVLPAARISAYRNFTSGDIVAWEMEFSHRRSGEAIARLEALLEAHAAERGAQISRPVDAEGRVHISVVRGPAGLHVRRSDNSSRFSSFAFRNAHMEHMALGWSPGVLWSVQDVNRLVILDYDVGGQCTTPLEVLLLAPGDQSFPYLQNEVRSVFRLGLPLSAGKIEWSGTYFHSQPTPHDRLTARGRLLLRDGTPGGAEWVMVDAQDNVVREARAELRYGSPEDLYPSEISVSVITPGQEEPLSLEVIADLRVRVFTEDPPKDRFSPMPYVLANKETATVSVISNKFFMTAFRNGHWLAEPVVAFRTDGRPVRGGSRRLLIQLTLLVLLLAPATWLFRKLFRHEAVRRSDTLG